MLWGDTTQVYRLFVEVVSTHASYWLVIGITVTLSIIPDAATRYGLSNCAAERYRSVKVSATLLTMLNPGTESDPPPLRVQL